MRINKIKTVTIAFVLMLTIAATFTTLLPTVTGQVTPVPNRSTGAYLSVNPPLIGLDQPLTVNLWVYPAPSGPNFETPSRPNQMRYHNITITFTRPDGTKDTFMPLDGSAAATGLGPGETQEVGNIWFHYYPNQVGTWTIKFSMPGQTFGVPPDDVYYETATSQIVSFLIRRGRSFFNLPGLRF